MKSFIRLVLPLGVSLFMLAGCDTTTPTMAETPHVQPAVHNTMYGTEGQYENKYGLPQSVLDGEEELQ